MTGDFSKNKIKKMILSTWELFNFYKIKIFSYLQYREELGITSPWEWKTCLSPFPKYYSLAPPADKRMLFHQ